MVRLSPHKTSLFASDRLENNDSIDSSIPALQEQASKPKRGKNEEFTTGHRFRPNQDDRVANEIVADEAVDESVMPADQPIAADYVFDYTPAKDINIGIVGLVAAYNEARFIGSVVIRALRFVDRVIVVDDGSCDDTVLIARAAGADVVRMQTNGGKGAAIQRGLEVILDLPDVRVIVLLDGDGQHDPTEIPGVVQPILNGGADLSVGSRFLDIKSEIPAWRQVGQHGLTWFTNIASGMPLTDSQSGFRALSPAAAKQLKFQTSDFSMESEMQFTVRALGLTTVEVPITCVYEEPSKRNPVTHGLEVVRGVVHLTAHVRPLFFGTVSAIALWLLGATLSSGVFMAFNKTGTLPLVSSLLTTGLIVMGSTAFICGIMLQSVRDLLKSYLIQKVDR